jgi:hypothetical protein
VAVFEQHLRRDRRDIVEVQRGVRGRAVRSADDALVADRGGRRCRSPR